MPRGSIINSGNKPAKYKIESAFSDSEDEDENMNLEKMPKPTSTMVRNSFTTSSSLSVQQGHPNRTHAQTHLHSYVPQQSSQTQQLQQQRKRLLSNVSSALPSSSASSVGGVRKAAPLSPLVNQSQSHSSNVGQTNDFDDEYSSGVHVNQMLSKLGADLQQKVRAKRQRLDEYFKNVKAAPAITLASRQRHIEQRNKLVDDLKTETGKLTEKLDSIVNIQSANQDKHSKMMLSLTRGSEQVRSAISECTKAQATLYEKFTAELKKLEDHQDEGTKELMERCESTLMDLQSKIANDQMKSETDSLFKLKFM